MKVQNLSIIFLIIVIPLIVILSYYLSLQQNTLKLQAEYDIKLAEATKEGIKAFEVNTVDWSQWKNGKTNQTRRNEAKATINTFTTSLANNLNISGTAKEYMLNYIPAAAVTLYDGYYVYSPVYAPIPMLNGDGVQLHVYWDSSENKYYFTTEARQGTTYPAYKPKTGATTIEAYYKDGSHTSVVIDLSEAETEYKHMLSNYMAYTARYINSSNTTNVIVNYTLDNRIYVIGKVNNIDVAKDGYLVYFDKNNDDIPRIKIKTSGPRDTSAIEVKTSVKDTIYKNISIKEEVLEEQILYKDGSDYKLGTFKYVYDINHERLYYDEDNDNFFYYYYKDKEKQYINNDTSVKVGSIECKYKSVSILVGDEDTSEYKKIYQVLNGQDKSKWYISIQSSGTDLGVKAIDNEITGAKLQELGLDSAEIYNDYSAISYYVEAYAFTNWVVDNLSGLKQQIYNETDKQYETKDIKVDGIYIFDINKNNNPEEENAPIVLHKKEIMKNHIITNLNLAISNYGRETYNFKLPVLLESDWEQIFSNISLITFFQGVPIGLKYYNNYAIATSTTNREYVDPTEIYLSGEDPSYHRGVYCTHTVDTKYTGYRSVEYTLKEFIKYDANNNPIGDPMYYYPHDDNNDATNSNSETACYYCLVNKENFVATADTNIKYQQAQSYYEALARERYYQKEQLKIATIQSPQPTPTPDPTPEPEPEPTPEPAVNLNVLVEKYKKEYKYTIDNKDIVFILDESGSMENRWDDVEIACGDILDIIFKEEAVQNVYVGFVAFESNAKEIGSITNASQLSTIKNNIINNYGGKRLGGTNFNAGLNTAKTMIQRDLINAGRTNKKIVIFMADGTSSQYTESNLTTLHTNYNIEAFYPIFFQADSWQSGHLDGGAKKLQEMSDAFKKVGGTSEMLLADDSTFLDRLKEILEQIKTQEEVDSKIGEATITTDSNQIINITSIQVSTEKTMTIEVRQNGTIVKTITISQYPIASGSIFVVENGNIGISMQDLLKEAGVANYENINITIKYYEN